MLHYLTSWRKNWQLLNRSLLNSGSQICLPRGACHHCRWRGSRRWSNSVQAVQPHRQLHILGIIANRLLRNLTATTIHARDAGEGVQCRAWYILFKIGQISKNRLTFSVYSSLTEDGLRRGFEMLVFPACAFDKIQSLNRLLSKGHAGKPASDQR